MFLLYFIQEVGMRNNSGFTLIELIIAVIIVGILSSIAIPNYFQSVERAKLANAISFLRDIRKAQIDYFTENSTEGDIAQLGTQVGADFTAPNSSWGIALSAANNDGVFTITATRSGGPQNGLALTLNELGVWGGAYDCSLYGMGDFD